MEEEEASIKAKYRANYLNNASIPVNRFSYGRRAMQLMHSSQVKRYLTTVLLSQTSAYSESEKLSGNTSVIKTSINTMDRIIPHQSARHFSESLLDSWRETGQHNFGVIVLDIGYTPALPLHPPPTRTTSAQAKTKTQTDPPQPPSTFSHPNLPTQEVSVCFIAKTQQAIAF